MIEYIRHGEIVTWKFSVPNKYYVLYRNGYLFGGAYFPIYYKYGGSKFFNGKYERLYPLPMLGVVGDSVAFIFYDNYEIDEIMLDIPIIDPELWIVEPMLKTEKLEIYYDEKLCYEYNKEFKTNFECPPNPIIVDTIPFIVVGKDIY